MPLWRMLVLMLTMCPGLAHAAEMRCADEAGLRSTEGTVATSLNFTNRMPKALRIYWINYNGARQFYGVVRPGQSFHQQTYVTHPWVLTDAKGTCVAVFMPAREPRRVVVTGAQAAAVRTDAKQALDVQLAGVWLALQGGVQFPLGCDSGEPVRYFADGTYAGPGARGTWRLQDGELTEVVTEVDAETGDASVKIGKPHKGRIVWKGPDTFVRTFPNGADLTFRRCVSAEAAAVTARKGSNDSLYHSCVEDTCTRTEATRSKAAEYLVREQIASACEKQEGTIDPASVIERDLDGDGKADLIIHHHGIKCPGGRSIFCGMQACSFQIYVRRGELLTLAGEFAGVEYITVGGEQVPTIRTVAHGCKPTALRWNGREFRWR